MEVTDQLHDPGRFAPGKGNPILIGQRVSGVPDSDWKVWRRKKNPSALGIPTPDRPARSLNTEADCELKIRSSNPDRGKSFNRNTLYI